MSLTGLECHVSGLINSDACPRPTAQELQALPAGGELPKAGKYHDWAQVSKTPSWPRSWANLSLC
jgi:hypothetical protein